MNIFVAKLSFLTREDKLKTLFGNFGEVSSVKIIFDKAEGRSKGFGFVEMAAKNDGIKAISRLDGQEVDGRNIKVNEGQKKPAGSSVDKKVAMSLGHENIAGRPKMGRPANVVLLKTGTNQNLFLLRSKITLLENMSGK